MKMKRIEFTCLSNIKQCFANNNEIEDYKQSIQPQTQREQSDLRTGATAVIEKEVEADTTTADVVNIAASDIINKVSDDMNTYMGDINTATEDAATKNINAANESNENSRNSTTNGDTNGSVACNQPMYNCTPDGNIDMQIQLQIDDNCKENSVEDVSGDLNMKGFNASGDIDDPLYRFSPEVINIFKKNAVKRCSVSIPHAKSFTIKRSLSTETEAGVKISKISKKFRKSKCKPKSSKELLSLSKIEVTRCKR
jgi:hypothetical protein